MWQGEFAENTGFPIYRRYLRVLVDRNNEIYLSGNTNVSELNFNLNGTTNLKGLVAHTDRMTKGGSKAFCELGKRTAAQRINATKLAWQGR